MAQPNDDYEITDPRTGRTLVVSGPHPPTQAEAKAIFDANPAPEAKSLSGFGSNVLTSGGEALGGLYNIFRHPLDTKQNIVNLGSGAIETLIPGEQGNEKYARAVEQFYKDRYGGLSNIGETLYKDPVGALLDASTVLGGGAGLAGKAGALTKIEGLTRVADVLGAAGEATNVLGQGARVAGKVGEVAGAGLKGGGVSLMKRIAKTPETVLSDVGPEWGATNPERATALAEGMIKEGANLKASGVAKRSDEIAREQATLQEVIDRNADVPVSTRPGVLNMRLARRKALYQSLPEADRATIQNALEEYQRHPLLSEAPDVERPIQAGSAAFTEGPRQGPTNAGFTTTTTSAGPLQAEIPTLTEMVPGPRKFLTEVPAWLMQKIKQGTYRSLGDKAYGELGSAGRGAQKALARGQATALSEAIPEVEPINKRIGQLIDLRDAEAAAAGRVGRANPLDLISGVVHGTPGMLAAAAMQRRLLGVPLSKMLYRLGGMVPSSIPEIPAGLQRLAMLAALQGEDKQ